MRHDGTVLGLALAITAAFSAHAAGQKPPQQPPAAPLARQEAVTRLLNAQLQAAQKAYRAAVEGMAVRQVGGLLVLARGDHHARPDLAYTWSVRWLQAQRDLSTTRDQRVAAFMAHQTRMAKLQKAVTLLVGDGNSGLLDASEAPAADWYLAQAELWLLKEQGAPAAMPQEGAGRH